MKKSTLITILVVLIILIIGGVVWAFSASNSTQFTAVSPSPSPTDQTSASHETVNPGSLNPSTSPSTSPSSSPSSSVKTYTLAAISSHNSASNCWTAIEGKVYDITSFIPHHPGGPIITQACGIDATQLFDHRPTDGTSHSSRARSILSQYYIGDLKS